MPSTLAVLAVVLGFMPAPDLSTDLLRVNYAALENSISGYSETSDRRGRIHLQGTNLRTSEPFDVVIDEEGHVAAVVGEKVVLFKVSRIIA
jgi:hypothetical protein